MSIIAGVHPGNYPV